MKIPPHHHNERASPLDASILGCAVSVILYVLSNQKSMFHPDLARLPQNFCAKHENSRKRVSHKNRSSIFAIINTYFFLLCDLGYKIFKQNMIKYEVSTGNTKRPPRHLSPPLIIPLWERLPAFLMVRQILTSHFSSRRYSQPASIPFHEKEPTPMSALFLYAFIRAQHRASS